MPLRILVVDDEPFSREMIIGFLKDADNKNIIVGEAINGKTAVDFISSHEVDLILTDIKMPVMDGLDLIKEVRPAYPDIIFVVLSAYNEFHLVKQAFRLGAQDYLLKSELTREELFCVLEKISKQMRMRTGKWEGKEQKISLLKKLFLRNPVFTPEEYAILGLPLDAMRYSFQILVLAVMGGGRMDWFNQQTDKEKSQKIFTKLQTCVEDNNGGNIITVVEANVLTVLIRYSQKSEIGENIPERIFSRAAACVRPDSYEVSGGVSSLSSDPNNLAMLYTEALIAKNYFFIRGRGKLIIYSGIAADSGKSESTINIQERLCKLRKLLQRENSRQCWEDAETFTVNIFHPSFDEITAIRNLFQGYYMVLQDAMNEKIPEISEGVKKMLLEYNAYIEDEGTLNEYNCWIRKTLQTLGASLNLRSPIVRKTIEYIRANYAREIKLSEIAKRFGVTESYISRLFSQEVQFSFVHYLSQIRMESALELLKSTNLKIYEIAERTGYPNTEHFSRTFKKIMGRSPKEYR
jgi:two-component system response regulator YesN